MKKMPKNMMRVNELRFGVAAMDLIVVGPAASVFTRNMTLLCKREY
jgi:hypothetical protein